MPRRTTVLLSLAAVGLAACSSAVADDEPAVTDDQVTVVDDAFGPVHVEVPTGGAVTWTWDGERPHDVVGDAFDSGIQDAGTFTHTFTAPGTYDYRCSVHRGMAGRVTVTS